MVVSPDTFSLTFLMLELPESSLYSIGFRYHTASENTLQARSIAYSITLAILSGYTAEIV